MSELNKPQANSGDAKPNESGRTLLIGLLGGVVSAAGYTVYNRLPPDRKERIQAQVRGLVEAKLTEVRTNLAI